jgi:hypothetical protein
MEMEPLQQFTGVSAVYRADGSVLPGDRHYSITLVPWYEPSRPLAIGSWVELQGEEPLELDNQVLSVQLSDRQWLTFRIIDVSETPPHHHTFIAQGWPSPRAARSAA